MSGALTGFRVGVTAARKAGEQIDLLVRRGADVQWAAALSREPNTVDDSELEQTTREVLERPVDLFLATTGIGMRTWFDATRRWGLYDDLVAALGGSQILARGPKSVGALRRNGLREVWAPESEAFEDVLAHLRGRDVSGLRIVVQEHGQSMSMAAHALRRRGADVVTVPVYRVESAEDPEPVFGMVDLVADRALDAVTFTSAPAIVALMEAASSSGRRDEVVAAFRSDVVACCVGPVTAAAFEAWDVPSIHPERSRLAAMINLLVEELPSRRNGVGLELAGGRRLFIHGNELLLDGVAISLSPAPAAVLAALLAEPGRVVSRPALLAALPSGQARSEHAVEMAVARLRAAVGTHAVQTVVKRGYRLAVA